MLNEFPGVWQDSATETHWRATANKVKQWKAQARNSYMDPKQKSSDTNEAALGRWINEQRKRKKENKLETWQIEYLNAIDGWVWDQKLATWLENAAAVQDFKDANARKLPSKTSANPHERRLGTWIANQKTSARDFTKAQNKLWKQLGI